MNARRFDAVLFDLDGTLVETSPEIADATNDLLRDLGLPPVAQPQVDAWIGHGTRELLVQALAHVRQLPRDAVRADGAMPTIAAQFDRHYHRRCGTHSRLYPRVMQTLQQLRDQGTRVGIVTNKEGRHTERVLAAHGLPALLDAVISGDSLPTKKPDPAGILQCLRQWGVAPARALFVGDSRIDIATARNAGVAVWALPYGYNMGEPVADSQPDRMIDDIGALVAT
ncbi:phosphoglycolate phosphatase [Comamonas badia]|jgi:phosphoglycolate phosphatase|uniref:phosphoglycolate phosphatase n=1 Tax=Comamonas badia TaxID=265291 RepID=UPI0004171B7D|nr:phosphoglycolate phosphatase [Comamonas badia]